MKNVCVILVQLKTAKKAASGNFTGANCFQQRVYQLETGSNVAGDTVTEVSIETSERHISELANDRPGRSRKVCAVRDGCPTLQELESMKWELKSIRI